MCKDSFQVDITVCYTSDPNLKRAQEGINKRIELKEQDPYLAGRMLQHLYTIDYTGHKTSIGDDEEPSHVSEFLTHVKMYALGDQYDIKDLKEEAFWKFEQAMKAKKGQSDERKTLLQVVPAIYATTPDNDRGLRDFVVAFGAQHLKRLKDLPEFEDVVIQAPKFMVEVLPPYFKEAEKKVTLLSCIKCSRTNYCQVICNWCGTEQPTFSH